ncbi:unnamed protein product [Musa textilis]
MASSQSGETVVTQCKNCRCGEADTKFWITRASDNPDKQTNTCPNCNVLKSGPLFISSKGSCSAVKPFLCEHIKMVHLLSLLVFLFQFVVLVIIYMIIWQEI